MKMEDQKMEEVIKKEDSGRTDKRKDNTKFEEINTGRERKYEQHTNTSDDNTQR